MEDFFYAGGLRALMANMAGMLDLTCLTVSGQNLGETLQGAVVHNDDIIRPLDNPVYHEGSLAVVKGNLAPDGAVMKPAACDPKFHVHEGPALVFDSYPEMKAAIDDEDLDVTADHVLVLRNAGPLGGPGMPEWGMLPIPKALIKKGHPRHAAHLRCAHERHQLRRLHPACRAGSFRRRAAGPAQDRRHRAPRPAQPAPRHAGRRRRARRAAAATGGARARFGRGYGWMFAHHVSQADKGCDFDYLSPAFGAAAGEPDIF